MGQQCSQHILLGRGERKLGGVKRDLRPSKGFPLTFFKIGHKRVCAYNATSRRRRRAGCGAQREAARCAASLLLQDRQTGAHASAGRSLQASEQWPTRRNYMALVRHPGHQAWISSSEQAKKAPGGIAVGERRIHTRGNVTTFPWIRKKARRSNARAQESHCCWCCGDDMWT